MCFAPIRGCAFLLMLTLVVAARAAAGPSGHEIGASATSEFPSLSTASDASGYYRMRSGDSSGNFYYMSSASDASGYYQASGSFQPVESCDQSGVPAYSVSWSSFNWVTGEYNYTAGCAPRSAVMPHGKMLSIDFDPSTMLEVFYQTGTGTWTGVFVPNEDGPGFWTRVISGNQNTRNAFFCQRLSGTLSTTSADFVGTCGSVVVPEPYPGASPNGYREVFRGTGWTMYGCPP